MSLWIESWCPGGFCDPCASVADTCFWQQMPAPYIVFDPPSGIPATYDPLAEYAPGDYVGFAIPTQLSPIPAPPVNVTYYFICVYNNGPTEGVVAPAIIGYDPYWTVVNPTSVVGAVIDISNFCGPPYFGLSLPTIDTGTIGDIVTGYVAFTLTGQLAVPHGDAPPGSFPSLFPGPNTISNGAIVAFSFDTSGGVLSGYTTGFAGTYTLAAGGQIDLYNWSVTSTVYVTGCILIGSGACILPSDITLPIPPPNAPPFAVDACVAYPTSVTLTSGVFPLISQSVMVLTTYYYVRIIQPS